MRLKFQKGFTPDIIAAYFLEYVMQEGLVVGDVNVYIQTLDEYGNPEPLDKKVVEVTPSERLRKMHVDSFANNRRKEFKVINS